MTMQNIETGQRENASSLQLLSTNRITVAGLPGQGKTEFGRFLAALAMPRVEIWDPLDQYNKFPEENRYVPKRDTVEELESRATIFCRISNKHWVIEEAEKYIRQGQVLPPNMFNLFNRGRNWGIGITAITRRIQNLDKNFFDLCQHAFFFKCGLKSREYIASMVGKQIAGQINALEKYEFLHFNLETEKATIMRLDLGPVSDG